ncbi:MAG: VOC family protein [Pseudonocardiaceae bacterium]
MFSKLTPNLKVPDVKKAVEFYESLGFTTVATVPEEGIASFAILVDGPVELMLQSGESLVEDIPAAGEREIGSSIVLYLDVDDIQALHDRVAGKAEVVVPMRDTFYGMREFYITDPHGYLIGFAQKVEGENS